MKIEKKIGLLLSTKLAMFRVSSLINANQAPVVQTMNSAIHRINHYPVDKS